MGAELIVALDVPTAADIPRIVDLLPEEVRWYKVGMELFTSEGPKALEYLIEKNRSIFLDLKFHDIPRTVGNAVATAARHGVGLLTVHAGGGRNMLEAAAEAAAAIGANAPRLVAVTTLTSLSQRDIAELGVERPLKQHTLALGQLAIESGIDGLVCSPLEVKEFRDALGDEAILVTPGIRPAGADVGDQKRIATPAMAVAAGSSFLVVGRPIVQAEDPGQAARDILEQMSGAA